jgi:hypothetical protein
VPADARSAVVHLVGRPGAGKRTVALALVEAAAAAGRTFVLLDNHRTGNLILSLVGADGRSSLPSAVWDRVVEVRDVVFRTIEELSPRDWSFVLTNVLLTDDPRDHAAVARIRALADSRGSAYLPVHVHCDEEELLRRVPNPERAALHKWVDPDGVRASFARPLLVPDGAVDLDTTALPPADSARWLLAQLEALA